MTKRSTAAKPAPAESIKELFYKGKDGYWYWKEDNQLSSLKGFHIGYTLAKSKRYKSVRINNEPYLAHRIIYWLETGDWPEVVDHIDRDIHNNHPSNLRPSDRKANPINKAFTYASYVNPNKDGSITYRVKMMQDGKNIYLGAFHTEAEAIFAGKFARSAIFGQEMNSSFYSERQVTEMYLLMKEGTPMLDVIKQYEPSLLFANQR